MDTSQDALLHTIQKDAHQLTSSDHDATIVVENKVGLGHSHATHLLSVCDFFCTTISVSNNFDRDYRAHRTSKVIV